MHKVHQDLEQQAEEQAARENDGFESDFDKDGRSDREEGT